MCATPGKAETADTSATAQHQHVHRLANGLTLLTEKVPNVRSATMILMVPAGAALDPATGLGSANVLSDWILRGAGKRNSRELSEYLDGLGVQRGAGAETIFIRFGASMLGRNLAAVLEVYAEIVQRPQLPESGFGPARDLAIQQLDAIEDEPAQKLSILLKAQHFPDPLGRPTVGKREHLQALTADQLRADFQTRFTPQGAILTVAGDCDFQQVTDLVEKHFGGWQNPPRRATAAKPAPRGSLHITQPTNQVQIGLAMDSVPESHGQSILIKMAVGVLSGGMGARLFSEIREKQGLCYSVHAGYQSSKEQAAILGYAGTGPDRAQRTLDSFMVELQRLGQGVTEEELERARIGMKSRTIMQGESPAARAGALAHDFYHYGRPRTLEELRARIESVALADLNEYLAVNPFGPVTLVTIGPNALTVPA
jgi:predicted Zn-dependent peptidase